MTLSELCGEDFDLSFTEERAQGRRESCHANQLSGLLAQGCFDPGTLPSPQNQGRWTAHTAHKEGSPETDPWEGDPKESSQGDDQPVFHSPGDSFPLEVAVLSDFQIWDALEPCVSVCLCLRGRENPLLSRWQYLLAPSHEAMVSSVSMCWWPPGPLEAVGSG